MRPNLDLSAVCLSGLCLVHCLVLPLVASFLPLLGGLASAEWVHLALAGMAAPIALLALRRSGLGLAALGVAGVALLLCGALGWPDHDWEQALTLTGGGVLATAHLLNWRRRTGARRAGQAQLSGG